MSAGTVSILARARRRGARLARRIAILPLGLAVLACEPGSVPVGPSDDAKLTVGPDVRPRCSIEALSEHRLLEALRAEQTYELTAYFSKLHEQYATEVNCDYAMVVGFSQLTPSEPWVTRIVDAWVEREPASWIAATARGYHYTAVAWESRGQSSYRKTTEEGRRGMREAIAVGAAELERAITLEPGAVPAHPELHEMAQLIGDREGRQELYERGSRAHPLSFQVHVRRMHGLSPKWGGSLAQMEAFALLLGQAAERNPELGILRAYPIYERSMVASRRKEPAKALELLDEALTYGTRSTWLIRAARLAHGQRRYDRGLAYLDLAEERWGPRADQLYWRGQLLFALNRNEEALETAQRAMALFPLDDRPPWQAGWAYRQLGRWQESSDAYETALEMDPGNRWVLTQYAWTLGIKLGRADKAFNLYARHLRERPNDPDLILGLGDLYADLNDPRAVPLLRQYLTLIDPEAPELRERVRLIREYLAQSDASVGEG